MITQFFKFVKVVTRKVTKKSFYVLESLFPVGWCFKVIDAVIFFARCATSHQHHSAARTEELFS